ncbi:hypothetical protein RRG08_060140 [Elysia crispata]|uniref:Uncharacterized protein n=1 Tax=Elysia crispata TaxID=231223 RepID=A0AAE1DQP9_9GAST|nr:hypothetical protein RRG08_060140 [Elysia crispata]
MNSARQIYRAPWCLGVNSETQRGRLPSREACSGRAGKKPDLRLYISFITGTNTGIVHYTSSLLGNSHLSGIHLTLVHL